MIRGRRSLLAAATSAPWLSLLSTMADLANAQGPTRRMPVIFVGHGSPMNAVSDNPFTRALQA